jgi:hypothetical protein
MPRNSSGVFTLAEQPFQSGTVVESDPVNNDLSDIATALTQSLATTGVSVMTGPFFAANGTVTAPSISFSNSVGTGFYRVSDNVIAYVVSGVIAYTVGTDRAIDAEVGIKFTNENSTDTDILDWYEEGTFTPVLRFGGNSVGITYDVRTATFTRIGNRVIFDVEIELSSAGSSSGDATLSGLPYAPSADVICQLALIDNFLASATEEPCWGLIDQGDNTIYFVRSDGLGGSFLLDNGDFTDASTFKFSGQYRVA